MCSGVVDGELVCDTWDDDGVRSGFNDVAIEELKRAELRLSGVCAMFGGGMSSCTYG